MDELNRNDEMLEEITEAPEAVEEQTESDTEDVSSESVEYSPENTGHSEDTDDDYEFETENEESEKTYRKKPFILQPTIIIACCILLISLLGFGAAKAVQYVLTPDIKGTWVVTKAYLEGYEDSAYKPDGKAENEVYLSFKDNNVYEVKTGSIKYTYKWSYADSKGAKTSQTTDHVMWYPEGKEEYAVVFECKVTGNRLSEKKLTTKGNTLLLNGYGMAAEVDKFKSCSEEKANSYKMKPDKNFKAENTLVGKWENKDYKISINFEKDGLYTLVTPTNTQSGAYIVNSKDKTLQLKYYSFSEGSTGDLPYEVNGDTLTVSGDKFKKVK